MLLKGSIFVVVRCVFQVCGLALSYNINLTCAVCPDHGRGGASFFSEILRWYMENEC